MYCPSRHPCRLLRRSCRAPFRRRDPARSPARRGRRGAPAQHARTVGAQVRRAAAGHRHDDQPGRRPRPRSPAGRRPHRDRARTRPLALLRRPRPGDPGPPGRLRRPRARDPRRGGHRTVSALLPLAVGAPALAGIAVLLAPARRLRSGGAHAAAAGSLLGLALTVALAVDVLGGGPVTWTPGGSPDGPGLLADRVSVLLLLLVLGVSAVVQAYTARYLCGDPRQRRLVVTAAGTTTAAAAMVGAATLTVLAAAWCAAGLGLLALLAQRADLPAARVGLQRTARTFAIGDLALLAAVAIVLATAGDPSLRDPGAAAAALDTATVAGVDAATLVACLLVLAAIARSALLPLHRWLPATLAAPTPVSALLHAGLVNAGGILLVRLAPLVDASALALGLAFAAGAATAVHGTALMLTRPDVKGALAHSTVGQMGFMVLACALGAYAAALLHLVAHGMYKATLFLGSGSVVHADKRRAVAARPGPRGVRWAPPVRLAAAALVPAVAIAAAFLTYAADLLDHPGTLVLVAFAWATAAHAAHAWLTSTPGRPLLGLAAVAAACLAYTGLITGADALLAPALPDPGATVSAWFALVPAAVLAAGLPVLRSRRGAQLSARLYVRALEAGRTAPRPRRDPALARRAHAPVVTRPPRVRDGALDDRSTTHHDAPRSVPA
ncbi:sodium:proton antiporter [Conexibacter sp. W3-3-2]|nr:sodium:proton antiporter [Conexibacter sp. W3-3-2]